MPTLKWIRNLFNKKPSERHARPRLEILEDRSVPAPLMVTTAADSGAGSLRAAINAANRMSGLVTIDFAIGATGSAHTINLRSALPTISGTVTIDGSSQGGSGYTGPDLIELNGAGAGTGANGLVLTGTNSTIEGLIIDRFALDGILLKGNATGNTIGGATAGTGNVISGNRNDGIEIVGSGATSNVVENNLIGTNRSGTGAMGNTFDGILIHTGASNNTIGGTSSGTGNVISGNGNDGVEIVNAGTTKNLVAGNLIGTDVTGTIAVANRFDGVLIRTGASSNTIGGTSSASGNVISGNGNDGVEIVNGGATNNLVQGNTIGAQIDGVSPLGNKANGIAVRVHAANNTIGGTAAGAGNIIAFNHGDGVLIGSNTQGVTAGDGNAIEGNSIFGNRRLGIFLGFDNTSKPPVVLANDAKGHTGVNNDYQNHPVLSAPMLTANSTVLSGTLSSPNNPGKTFRIEFFSSTSADPSGHGQGMVFLGAVTVTTNASGKGSFSLTLTTRLAGGEAISATATDPLGNTSEFSRDVTVP